ncbi:MAG: aspartyl/glutamyl-tRNA amidotransferase subunit C [Defluviitaleaceae bacterium]|nr:aspartyl/glutamyl-tRNA amidotransferase subunit C [Defluviitaleaceae bacterium]
MMTMRDLLQAAAAAKLDISAYAEEYLRDINGMMKEMRLDLLAELPITDEPYPVDTLKVNFFREDIVRPSLPREEVLAKAPAAAIEAGCISVPKMNVG